MVSPASTSTTSPLRSSAPRSVSASAAPCCGSRASWRLTSCLHAAQRGGLRLAAPSASASAKLANSTVNHSHSAIAEDEAGRRLARARPAPGRTAPWSGCCRRTRRTSPDCATARAASSLLNESRDRRRTISAGSNRDGWLRAPWLRCHCAAQCVAGTAQLLDAPGPAPAPARRSARRPARTVPTSSTTNSGPWVGIVPGRRRACASSRPASRRCASTGTIRRSGRTTSRSPSSVVVKRRVGRQAGEGAAVVVRRRTERVQDLG